MSNLSLLEKLGLFLEVAKDSYWSVLVLVILLVLSYIFTSTNKKNSKRNKLIYIVSSIVIIVSLLIGYSMPISKIFDNMINNLFIVVYFPNLAIYFGAIIATCIITFISLFSYKTSDIIKRLNLIIYIIMNYLFALLLYVIKTNKLDIFSGESIYNNSKATSLIELSSIIFILWILFLIIYKVILVFVRKDYKEKEKKVIVKKVIKKLPENYKNVKEPDYVYIDKPSMVKVVKDNKLYTEIDAPKLVYGDISRKVKQKSYYVIDVPSVVQGNISKKDKSYYTINLPDRVYGNNNKKKTDRALIKEYDDMLSVDDYKLLLKLLLKEKTKDKKEVIKEEKVEVSQPNLTELENLYRSIR